MQACIPWSKLKNGLSTLSCVSVFNHNMTQLWLCLLTVNQLEKIKALRFPVPGNFCPKLQKSSHCTREWGSIVILMLAHKWWLLGLSNFYTWPKWMCLCSPHETRPCIIFYLSGETVVNKTGCIQKCISECTPGWSRWTTAVGDHGGCHSCDKNKKQRLKLAKDHKTENRKTVWSIESWFLLQHSGGKVRVWHKQHK